MVKVCVKCLVEKEVSDYHKDKQKSDGISTICKLCKKEYYSKNRDKIRSQQSAYQKSNPRTRTRNYDKEYYEANKESRLEYQKEYNAKNKESRREYNLRYKSENRDSIKKYRSNYNLQPENAERIKKLNQQWQQSNKDKNSASVRNYLARKVGATGLHTSKDISSLKSKQTVCICGQSFGDLPHTVEHIVPLSRGGSNDISNLMLMCKSCNSQKGNKLPSEYVEYLLLLGYTDKAMVYKSLVNI